MALRCKMFSSACARVLRLPRTQHDASTEHTAIAACGPGAFITGVIGEHFPQWPGSADRPRQGKRGTRSVSSQASCRGVFDQPLHAIDFAADAFGVTPAALARLSLATLQAAQWRAQFAGQIAQQLLLQGDVPIAGARTSSRTRGPSSPSSSRRRMDLALDSRTCNR